MSAGKVGDVTESAHVASVVGEAHERGALFREEVLQARQAQWLGVIRIGRPLSFTLVTTTAIAIAGALVAFALWGEVTRKSTVHGVLQPIGGLLHVGAPQVGVISELLVAEGDTVVAGQPLARLRSDRTTTGGVVAALHAQSLQARRSSLQAERRLAEQSLRQRQDSLLQRLQSLQGEQRQALGELDTMRLRVQLASQSLGRQEALGNAGFVSAAQVQTKHEELLDLQLRERNVERSLRALDRDLQAVRAERLASENAAQTTLAQLDRTLASLDQESTENDSRSGLTVTAPQAGRLSSVPITAGQAVQLGQTVASLIPNEMNGRATELQAELYAPSRAVGFARPGQEVYMKLAAYPYQKFGMAVGKVVAISGSPILPQDLPAGQAQTLMAAAKVNEPLYRITVQLSRQTVMAYGKLVRLTAGMSLDAEVRQEHRRIWEWMLEPAMSARL